MRDDRRKDLRRRVFFGANATDQNAQNYECIIRNISDHGARIDMAECDRLGDAFTILVHKDGRQLRARVRWREGQAAGIDFIDIPCSSDSSNDNADEKLASRGLLAGVWNRHRP